MVINSVTRFSTGVKLQKMCFIIPNLWPVNTQSGVTTIEILFVRFSTRVAEILFCDFLIWNRNWIIFIRKVKKRYKFFVTTRKLWTKLFDNTNFIFDFAYKKFDFWALSLLLRVSYEFDSRWGYQNLRLHL